MRLQTILALVVVFAGTIQGHISFTEIEATCDATQDVSCDGTVGQPLYLQMISKEKAQRMQQEYELKLIKKNNNGESRLLRSKENSPIEPRWTFCPDNGTLIINPVEWADFGMYKVQIYLTNGTSVASTNMTLMNESGQISRWNENLIRILCSIGVVIIAVVILLNRVQFCQQRGVGEGMTETNPGVCIPMVSQSASVQNEPCHVPRDINK
ncbi:uncharacterized protein LOC121695020 [Alosa sapidissima]|uniref:uncharacterized protein LOC121695019 n=1 Tax=Alosa sapidissima TaxID=34773 RepID=UPI001C0891A3|nr:uncharacterized protein LOC121695019 [Alosa sapidissima]XP_041931434.1 uncharacterized protein LOC121695020 [Alosa sapidissima]